MKTQSKNRGKRILAWALAVVMVASIFTSFPNLAVLAAEEPKLLQEEQATAATELLYEEAFEYANTTLQEGENEDYHLYVPSGASASIKDGKLYYETTNQSPLYILGGEMWGYYTVEADITYETEAKEADLCFYVQDAATWSKGSITAGSKGTTYRVKIEANGTSASVSYAEYGLLRNLGEWTTPSEITVPVSAQSGSVGFAMTPAEGAESAAMYIDNIKVTRNMDVEEAKHTLFSVDFNGYASSKNLSATNTYADYYIKTSTSGITAKVSDQKLYVTGDGNGYGVMCFDVPDAVHWENYVVEVDMCQTTDTGWSNLLYRVQNLTSFQAGGLYGNGTAGLKGYWNGWANDGEDNGILHETSVTDVEAGQIYRLKIVVNGEMADLYVASYTDNDNTKELGAWQYLMSINDIADHHEKGSVGFLTAEGASFWVDNLDVYEYATTYYEDFDSYEDVALAEGTNDALGMTFSPNTSTTATGEHGAKIENHVMKITGNATNSFELAWFNAGENWTNYTFEADVTPTACSGNNGLAYRVKDRNLWQRAQLRWAGANYVDTYVGVCQNGQYTPNCLHLDRELCPNVGAGFGAGKTLRVKIVVENNCTWLYTASYNATTGILGPYVLQVVRESCESFVGAAGMVVHGVDTLIYDNIVVSGSNKEAGTTNLANISVPETGIINPSTVVTKVNKTNYAKLEGTAVAILEINSNLDIVAGEEVIGSVSQFMNVYGDTVIPAFHIDEEAEVTAICDYLKKNIIADAFYVVDSADVALLKTAREAWGYVRGIVEYKTMPEDHAQARRDINNNMATVVILPQTEELTMDLVTEYHARMVSVWSYANNTAEVYKGIANGYAGVITNSPSTVLNVYSGIAETTLSGEPIVMGHQGVFIDGECYGNTIEAYQRAIKEGAKLIEIDTKKTSDGYYIMMHDETIDRTTNGSGKVANMTLAQIQQYKTKDGYKIPTFEEAMAYLATTDAVVIFDKWSADKDDMAKYKQVVTDLHMEDQVIALCGRSVISSDNYYWTNNSWGDGVPAVGGSLWISKAYNSQTTKEEYISDMIHNLSRFNQQQMPFDYKEASDPYGAVVGNNLKFYDEKSLSYEVSARGFLSMQCTTLTEKGTDEAYITNMGTVAVMMNDLALTKDYHYQIQAKDEIVKIGDALELTQTVKKIQGTAEIDCKVQWLSGDVIVASGDSYTMNQEGSATVVYYADITQERDYGTLEYRIYSEPVTITWNEEGKPHEHSYKYEADAYYHWEVCSCGDTKAKVVHTPELVGKQDATETVAGYTGDKVCSVCEYVMEQGDTVPYNRFEGFTYVTPEDYGFTYGEVLPESGYSYASKFPTGSMDKVLFITRLENFAKSYLTYMRDSDGNYYGLQFYGVTNSGTTSPIYLRLSNYLPGGAATTDDKIYTSAEDTTGSPYINIKIYESAYNFDASEEFELWISTEYCDYDGDNNGNNDDIKVGIWLNGKLYYNQYYYLKDCATICQPGLRMDAAQDMNFKEATDIVIPHTHTYGAWKHDQEGHWHICTSCGKVADQTLHTETLVGQKDATATENGYTGDQVCETCGYVIKKGETTYFHEYEGYTIVTPADYGFTYGEVLPEGASGKEASKYPSASLDKTVFVIDFNVIKTHFAYMRDGSGIYNALCFLRQDYSETTNSGWLYMRNYAGDGKIYTIDATSKQPVENTYCNIRVHQFGNLAEGGEIAIVTSYCDFDGDEQGLIHDDIKITVWVNGKQSMNSSKTEALVYYLKDCAGVYQPGLKTYYSEAPTTLLDPTASDETIQPTITDSIALNYTATVSSMMAKTETPTMTFERNGKVYGPVTGHPVSAGSNVYSFTYPDIMAQDMNQTIKATLTVGSQTTTYKYSVLEYCQDILAATSLEGYTEAQLKAAKALVVDLVQYGSALQTYRGVAAGSLHTTKIANWSDYVAAYDKADTNLDSLGGSVGVVTNKLVQEEGIEASTDYQWKGVSLVLGNKAKIRYRFTATNIYNLTVKVQIGDNAAEEVEFAKTGKANEYTFDFEDIYAYEYGTVITVRFYEGDTQVGGTVNYSVNTYLYGMKDYSGSKADELKALLLAIHNYGEAAQSYQEVK